MTLLRRIDTITAVAHNDAAAAYRAYGEATTTYDRQYWLGQAHAFEKIANQLDLATNDFIHDDVDRTPTERTP